MPDSTTPPPHTHRVTLLIALAGILLAGYALWRIDGTRDREDATRERVSQLEAAQAALKSELAAAAERESRERIELERQWDQLAELPQQVRDLTAAHEDLRARTERPQRAWNRAEAQYLIELAQRRLSFDHDTTTAISALEAADARLAALRDSSLNSVRERLAKDLRALRMVPEPDRAGIVNRLLAIELQSEKLPLAGVLVGKRSADDGGARSESIFGRIWSAIASVFDRLFTVRTIDPEHGGLVSLEEQALRRQHLALLLFSARNAALRIDAAAYRAALTEAGAWLGEYFGPDAGVAELRQELAALAATDIAPALPDVSATAQSLSRSGGTPALTP